ncbi:chemotaxis protein CheB [Candidatus Sumerlaeota bacterium]|nr:chemotaxis protein CheB [Candidatus Sumerlaeota bacterium]
MTPPARLIVIGTSLGGLNALRVVLGGLPADFPFPVAALQHRGRGNEGLLSELLQEKCAMPVREAFDKETILPGRVYLAPADYHLLIEGDHFALSTDEPVRYCRPSIDLLFETAADSFGAGAIGVILTGANNDGADGSRRIKEKGGVVVVQNPQSAECPIMPEAAIASAHQILELHEIAGYLRMSADPAPAGENRQ